MKETMNNDIQRPDLGLDEDFDALITQAMERREMLAELEKIIVTDIERESRRQFVRRWARIVAFCFTLAAVMVITSAGIDFYLRQHGATPTHVILMLIPAAALTYAVHIAFENFSLSDV